MQRFASRIQALLLAVGLGLAAGLFGWYLLRPAPSVQVGLDCNDLQALAPEAILGQLSDEVLRCLLTLRDLSRDGAVRDRASRVMLANAWGAGDKSGWEALAHHHLERIDASDPELAYKYALRMVIRGDSARAIFWADTALSERQLWTGEEYTGKVYALYGIRARAAEKALTTSCTAHPEAEESARRRLLEVSAEWVSIAATLQRPAERARALHVWAQQPAPCAWERGPRR